MNKDISRTFIITKEEHEKIKAFHPKCKKKYMGAIGGGFTYSFIPTSLGCVVTFKCVCGEVLDLTDYDSW